jgi:starvation-inducible DNA-binding protein
VDLIAERGVALGGVAEGTVQMVSRRSKLPEYAAKTGEWTVHVEAMRTALATFGSSARRAIDEATDLKDADTADLFTEVSRGIDKLLWMVEAHVQK